jgi:hypothetical protein
MTNPTTNFGWVMPSPTDLVTDLPADFEVFGQAVDTDFVDLLGGTTGQVLSKTTNTDLDFTWVTPQVGDITAVTVTAPITGGGTSGSVGIAISGATTSAAGAVQLSDSTSTTSSVLASTPTATKAAYDLANAAIAKSTVTTAGDIIYRNATVPTRLGIGTAGQVLKVNSGATAPEWGSATSGMTLITRSSFSNQASVIYDDVFSSTYGSYLVVIEEFYTATVGDDLTIKLRYGSTTQANSYRSASIATVYNSASIATVVTSSDVSWVLMDNSGSSTEPSRGHFFFPKAGVVGRAAINGQITNIENSRYFTFNASNYIERTYTGLLFQSSASNVSGTVAIYGMAV